MAIAYKKYCILLDYNILHQPVTNRVVDGNRGGERILRVKEMHKIYSYCFIC